MLNHYAVLAFIHMAISTILSMHGALAEAYCVAIAAAVYASMPPSGH